MQERKDDIDVVSPRELGYDTMTEYDDFKFVLGISLQNMVSDRSRESVPFLDVELDIFGDSYGASKEFQRWIEERFKEEYQIEIDSVLESFDWWYRGSPSALKKSESQDSGLEKFENFCSGVMQEIYGDTSLPLMRGVGIDEVMGEKFSRSDIQDIDINELRRRINLEGLELEYDRPVSWTANPVVAKDFAKRNGGLEEGFVLLKNVSINGLGFSPQLVRYLKRESEYVPGKRNYRFEGDEIYFVGKEDKHFYSEKLSTWQLENLSDK